MNREKVRLFENIYKPIRVLMSLDASLEEGMQATVDIATELGVERICIFLKDPTDNKMTLICGHPKEKHGLKNKRDLDSHPGLREIMERKKMFIARDPTQDKRVACTPEFCKLHQINASLFMRLEVDKNPIGAIVIDAVGEKKTFTKSDIHIAKMIALLATKRIHNRKRAERWERAKIFKLVSAEIAHEIRNPLTAVGGFAGRLEKNIDENPEKAKKYAKIIREETEKIESIIKSISQLLNQEKIIKKKENLTQIIEALVKETKEYIPKNKKILIHFDKKSNTPWVYLDEKQINTALIQIFKNAVDAIEKEGEIFIKTRKDLHFVCLEIENTGSHIPKDGLEAIFTPFYTTKRACNGGIGLGLAITRQIIEGHDGQIEVTSQRKPQKRTSFKILLPKSAKKT